MSSILFKNAGILATNNNKFEFIEKGYLAVDGDKIDYIGKEEPKKKYKEEKDSSGLILTPGFVNCHGHSAMTLLRGVGSDLPLQDWLHVMWPVEDRMNEDDLRCGMELAIMEMLSSGTTSFTDMYLMPWAVADTIGRSGIKANFSRVMQAFSEMSDSDYDSYYRVKETEDLVSAFHNSYSERLKVDYAIHAEYTCKPLVVRRYSEDCLKKGLKMQIHLSETKKEHVECIEKYGKTPTEWFNDLGCFENPTLAAHCVWVEESDMDILKEKGVTVVHNPTSNLKLGSGFAPIPKMIEKGINVALGTDGAASNNNLNFMEEIHFASIIHNGRLGDPTVMDPETVLKMATINGAMAQGREDTGSLEVGKKADIVAFDVNKPHLTPNLNPEALLVYSAQGSDVCMTMVDGNILYENGEFKTIDRERVYSEVKKSIARLY
ncbi:MAG: amidohydrolase [Spirochaetales bacterium]|nr:amidohydrolase [Spirochaetales bacterium]